jgi:hypothetical protein
MKKKSWPVTDAANLTTQFEAVAMDGDAPLAPHLPLETVYWLRFLSDAT